MMDEESRPSSDMDDFGHDVRRQSREIAWENRTGANTFVGRLFWRFWMSLSLAVLLKALFLALAFAGWC